MHDDQSLISARVRLQSLRSPLLIWCHVIKPAQQTIKKKAVPPQARALCIHSTWTPSAETLGSSLRWRNSYFGEEDLLWYQQEMINYGFILG